MANPLDDVDAFLHSMEEYARLGVDLVEVMPLGPDPHGYVTDLCERVAPRLAAL